MIRLSFLGGAQEVGRSATLVDSGVERMLLDYGIKINVKPTDYPEKVKGNLSAVLLSHAHLDHSGAIPVLFNQGRKIPVYGLNITKLLTRMLLIDSHKIARYEGEEERYTKKDIRKTTKNFIPVKYKKTFRIGNVKVTPFDAGHISGSVMYLLEIKGKRLLYACDYNLSDTRLIKGADMNLPEVHYLITESTYAQREHPDRQNEERKMMKAIKETLSNDGIAIISSFAIARAQEIFLILDEYEPKAKIYVDGMAQKATRIIAQYPELQKDYNILERALQRLEIQTISNPRKRKNILKKPCIIITTSGMLSGGPVVHYLEKLYDKENCSLILTGFQVPGTEGAVLLETGHYIHGDLDLELKMNVRKFDFSSHASRTELFRFVKHLNPEKVFCVHGDNTEGFAEELREEGFDAIAPNDDRIFNLD